MGMWLVLMLLVQEALSLNFNMETSYAHLSVLWFFSVHSSKFWGSTLN